MINKQVLDKTHLCVPLNNLELFQAMEMYYPQ